VDLLEGDRDLPGLRTARFRGLEAIVDDTLARERLAAALAGFFGMVAALLVAVGVYGLLSNSITQRKREFGVRLAIGAAPTTVVRLILRHAAMVSIAGICVGLPLSYAIAQMVRSQIFGLDPAAPEVVFGSAVGVLLVILLASIVPAMRLAKLDPAAALRGE
jgi:ABC-type antimicrobial peptide transport system permease subunit